MECDAGVWKRSEGGDPPLQLHCSPGSIDQKGQSLQSSPESAYREAILCIPKLETWHMAF